MRNLTLPLLPGFLLTIASIGSLAAQDEIFLSGASLSVVPIVNGGISADGQDAKWDSGYRVELHFRDYYFKQQSHHPFAELGVFYEAHDTSSDNFKLDSETIALHGAVGSAIPLWQSATESVIIGVTPEIGLNLGVLSLDAKANGVHSDDNAFRYGASGGVNAWVAINRGFSLGVGVIGSYWRATSVDLTVPNGAGTEERSDTPSGWDLGVRLSVGFMF
ncbi:MAG TPA: hypothetical protein VHX44_18155 [Planctomycetota bacterium]|nr:hypothetical protein [Planctomycetota bacterium]